MGNNRRRHKFLEARRVNELFIVCRIDDYADETHESTRGGFQPSTNYGHKGGYLWPTLKQANDAARHMVEKYPEHQYGVFKLVAIAEMEVVRPPIHVTIIG